MCSSISLLPTIVCLLSIYILAQSKQFLYKNMIFVKLGKVREDHVQSQAYFSTNSKMSYKRKPVTVKNKNREKLRPIFKLYVLLPTKFSKLYMSSSKQACERGSITTPILQVKKRSYKEVEKNDAQLFPDGILM